MIDREEQDRLRRIQEQQKVPSTVIKSRESSGMSAFLKKQDPNLEELKKKYFSDGIENTKSSAYKAEKT